MNAIRDRILEVANSDERIVAVLLDEARQITGDPADVEPHLLLLTTPWSE
jgi:hypothetical protein